LRSQLFYRPTPTRPPTQPFPYPTLFRSFVSQRSRARTHSVSQRSRARTHSVSQRSRARNGQGGESMRGIGLRVWSNKRSRTRREDRKSTRLNSSHVKISYAVFCLKKKK